ncbi:phosphoglycolate phosphatase [Microvirga flocculans]|uniref:Phosphoglycolate phosphatase n=1 Tax=Microvirga flocculans TaxID=217168 RepID=A0A7W6N9W9_9HYPH|nr:HAD-IA family hydrolase [Microvirga flocculans]MBB4041898.1 phosphoglycolate phosphatase [Microvirga flocculans]
MKLILFDVDGTLIDSQNIIVSALQRTFDAHGLEPPSRERGLSIVGLSLAEAFTALAGEKAPIASMVTTYKEVSTILRRDPAHAEPLFPGAGECIETLRRREGVLLGIATGNSRRGVARHLDSFGWHGVFSSIQTADDAPSKPHPAMILQAMRETGAAPHNTVMIGDSSYDMAMARSAGVMSVGVSWGFQPVTALAEAGAGTVVNTYAELGTVLDEFLARPSQMSA